MALTIQDPCTNCGVVKGHDEYFHYTAKGKQYRRGRCKACYSDENYDRVLKRQWGLTREEYDAALERQGGVCAICGGEEVAISKHGNRQRLSVDHCHETGQLRGLLCMKCNTAIGKFDDDCGKLESAIDYLKEPPCPFG